MGNQESPQHFLPSDLGLAEEMARHVTLGSPYVVVTHHGKEFNMVIDGAEKNCLYGHVAMNRHFVLYAFGNRPDMKPAIVEKQENVSSDSSKLAVFQEPCVVGSGQELVFNASAIAILEKPWRRFIPVDIYDASARPKPLDAKKLITVFPELARYYKEGIGFVKPQFPQTKKPPALPPQPGQPPTLRMIDNTKPTVAKSHPVTLEGELVPNDGEAHVSSESEE